MIDKNTIQQLLVKHWTIGPVAEELGIGYSTLRKRIKQYGIDHNGRTSRSGVKFDRNKHTAKKVSDGRRQRKLDSLEYKGGMRCERCGFSEPIPDCYAFHHIDSNEKDPNWSKMKTNLWSWEAVQKELDKCQVLCHNCHSIVHYQLRQSQIES